MRIIRMTILPAFLILSSLVNAQFELNEGVDQTFGIDFSNGQLRFLQVESLKFKDLDGDGDEDVFYARIDTLAGHDLGLRLIRQLNQSTDDEIMFGDPETIITFSSTEYYRFDPILEDLDQDGDWDVYAFGRSSEFGGYGMRMYENTSSQLDEFIMLDDVFLPFDPNEMNNGDYTWAGSVDLDHDGDMDILSYGTTHLDEEPFEKHTFFFLENRATNELLPFDTIVINPFGLEDVVEEFTQPNIQTLNLFFADANSDGWVDLVVERLVYDTLSVFAYDYFEHTGMMDQPFSTSSQRILTMSIGNEDFTASRVASLDFVDLDADGDLDVVDAETIYVIGVFGGTEILSYTSSYYENVFRDAVTSVNSSTYEAFAFPNPSNDQIYLDLSEFTNRDILLEIYDVAGRLIYQEDLHQHEYSIQKEDVGTGLFYVVLHDVYQSVAHRIVFLEDSTR